MVCLMVQVRFSIARLFYDVGKKQRAKVFAEASIPRCFLEHFFA